MKKLLHVGLILLAFQMIVCANLNCSSPDSLSRGDAFIKACGDSGACVGKGLGAAAGVTMGLAEGLGKGVASGAVAGWDVGVSAGTIVGLGLGIGAIVPVGNIVGETQPSAVATVCLHTIAGGCAMGVAGCSVGGILGGGLGVVAGVEQAKQLGGIS